jgi:hypothetical protein
MAANVAAPMGFITCRRYDGASPNYAMQEGFIAYNYGSRINYGDPVYRYTDGNYRLYAAAGTTVHGIFRGCRYLDPGTGRTTFFNSWTAPTLASTTVVYALVDADPYMTYMCQAIGSAIDITSIGKNIDITTSTSGTSTNPAGMSTCSLATSGLNTTATLPFRVQGIVGLYGTLANGVALPAIIPGYIATNDNQWLEVTLNTSDFTTRTGQA